MKKSFGAKTMIFPTPVWVICTYDANGKPNAMTAAWAGVACSQPPAISVSLRKATYSYQCILDRKAFTSASLRRARLRRRTTSESPRAATPTSLKTPA
jgi:flavin reductase (DIM6/NTAB) family NADH-FMN oxidoreductase RutF